MGLSREEKEGVMGELALIVGVALVMEVALIAFEEVCEAVGIFIIELAVSGIGPVRVVGAGGVDFFTEDDATGSEEEPRWSLLSKSCSGMDVWLVVSLRAHCTELVPACGGVSSLCVGKELVLRSIEWVEVLLKGRWLVIDAIGCAS